jgi:hypothetical protein
MGPRQAFGVLIVWWMPRGHQGEGWQPLLTKKKGRKKKAEEKKSYIICSERQLMHGMSWSKVSSIELALPSNHRVIVGFWAASSVLCDITAGCHNSSAFCRLEEHALPSYSLILHVYVVSLIAFAYLCSHSSNHWFHV